ncbi:MAG: DUF4878 domain-containing protein [Bacteroidales bacterium]|nr:DUF4878 domain-containing protein [Bacteroidales bacterium]
MRFFKYSIFLLSFACLLGSCTEDADQKAIKEVALNYVDATSNYDLELAEQYATQQTKDITLSFFKKTVMPHLDSATMQKNMPAENEIVRVRMISDTTAVAYYHKKTPRDEYTDSLNVVKQNGQWLVDFVVVIPSYLNLINDTTTHNRLPDREEIKRSRKSKNSR